MKRFTKEEIDEWRKVFTERKYPKEKAHLDDRIVDYFVMPSDQFKGIPNGLFRMTGNPQDGYLIGVSSEVPSNIQPDFAVSEHDEFMVFGLDDLDRTLHSEQNMLRILRDNSTLRSIYVSNKLTLYNHMLIHAKNDLEQWSFTEQDYEGFIRASEYLKSKLS